MTDEPPRRRDAEKNNLCVCVSAVSIHPSSFILLKPPPHSLPQQPGHGLSIVDSAAVDHGDASSHEHNSGSSCSPGRATSGQPSGPGQGRGACSRRRCRARNRTKSGARSGRHDSRFPRPIRAVRFRRDPRPARACRPATRSMSGRPPGEVSHQAQPAIVQQRQNDGRPRVTNDLPGVLLAVRTDLHLPFHAESPSLDNQDLSSRPIGIAVSPRIEIPPLTTG